MSSRTTRMVHNSGVKPRRGPPPSRQSTSTTNRKGARTSPRRTPAVTSNGPDRPPPTITAPLEFPQNTLTASTTASGIPQCRRTTNMTLPPMEPKASPKLIKVTTRGSRQSPKPSRTPLKKWTRWAQPPPGRNPARLPPPEWGPPHPRYRPRALRCTPQPPPTTEKFPHSRPQGSGHPPWAERQQSRWYTGQAASDPSTPQHRSNGQHPPRRAPAATAQLSPAALLAPTRRTAPKVSPSAGGQSRTGRSRAAGCSRSDGTRPPSLLRREAKHSCHSARRSLSLPGGARLSSWPRPRGPDPSQRDHGPLSRQWSSRPPSQPIWALPPARRALPPHQPYKTRWGQNWASPQTSLDGLDLESRYFPLATSLSALSCLVLSDTQLDMPHGLHLPTTFSATSLTAFSNDSYRSVMGVDMLLHWRTSNLLESSSWNCSFVAASWSFFQLNFGLLQGFALKVLRLQTSLMLTIRWSESSSTELYWICIVRIYLEKKTAYQLHWHEASEFKPTCLSFVAMSTIYASIWYQTCYSWWS